MSVTHSPERSMSAERFGECGRIAAGKDVFAHPGAGRAGPALAADRMQQRHAVVAEQSLKSCAKNSS